MLMTSTEKKWDWALNLFKVGKAFVHSRIAIYIHDGHPFGNKPLKL